MSAITAASNLNEPPPNTNQPPSPSRPSSFSSLPNDIILEILARTPKRYYPILSCVSKKFRILVRSRDIQKTRSLLGKDSLYLCFDEKHADTRNWFTLRRKTGKNPTGENLFVPIDVPNTNYSSVIAFGPEIFIIGGVPSVPSSILWIFDSRSGKFRRGPSMQVELDNIVTVGLVDGKMYVIGWENKHDKIRVDFLDLNTQIWKRARIPEGIRPHKWMRLENNVVLDRKVCWLNSNRRISCYNTRVLSESFAFANGQWCSKGMCVIDNVLYVYYCNLGLMWYDSKQRKWRRVSGFLDHFNMIPPIAMAEYYGKLAYLWTKSDGVVGSDKKQIWCRMIALDRNEVGIHGTAEPSQLLGTVPRRYLLRQCLSLSG